MWNFFKTACNTNPAKTIVQKVTEQQPLGLMQWAIQRQPRWNVQVGTVKTKEPRRRLILPPTVCVFDFPPKLSIQQTHLEQPSQLWWRCSPEETVEKEVSWGHEDPQQAGWGQRLEYSHVLWWKMWASGDCSGSWGLVITSHPTSLHWMLPDSYTWGCLPRLTLIKKHKDTNLSLSLLVCGTRTPPQNISLA